MRNDLQTNDQSDFRFVLVLIAVLLLGGVFYVAFRQNESATRANTPAITDTSVTAPAPRAIDTGSQSAPIGNR